MKKLLKRFIRDEKGQAVVEMAICLPILLLLVLGICDFGWIFYNQMSVENASREGARYAAVHAGESGLPATVTERAAALCMGDDGLTVTISMAGGDATVTVTKVIPTLTPLAGIFTGGQTIALESTTVMKQG